MQLVIIDTGCANIASVAYALKRLNVTPIISADPEQIAKADKLLLPGVGSAAEAMKNLQQRQLIPVIQSLTQPVLGICLGMQLLAAFSAEGETACLGVTEQQVVAMHAKPGQRLPHMGWNSITPTPGHPLFKGVKPGSYLYFVHSYCLPISELTAASCDYGQPFSAAISKDNFFGVQFHPERSAAVGATILNNFLEL